MIVKEYWPGFVGRIDPPKEARVNTQDDAVMVPWISERKGILIIDKQCVSIRSKWNDKQDVVIAVFMNDDGTPIN